ncbi:MAG: FapA family protein [Methylobacter sp.]|nr:FapA family protein [Methylobacter sp.]MDP2430156.1 FapA family protein [Methylobacter sp.]MDP3056341.1 FapA family protein [Methylobacter sp.]MDP3363283.1 FapA family protein [Methylobacter sp.]
MNDTLPPDALTFKLSDDGNKLLAMFEVSESRPPLDLSTIKQILEEQNLPNLFLSDSALTDLLQKYKLNESCVLEIGERRNGICKITVDSAKMSAKLTLTPPYGGTPVTLAQIQQELKERGVVYGILDDKIKKALKDGYATELVIAQGLAAVAGTDTQFQSLIPEIRERKPQIDKKGFANYRDLGQLNVVRQGEPLMRRIPPTEGTRGQDVTGQILSPQPGKDTPFTAGLQGAEVDQNDNSLLVATITGQPKLVINGVIVEPTINLPLVDLSTGNMNFEGTINIKGDVREGMKIYATGDVFVGGTVEAAEIEAGGNIVIKGGVIGRTEHKDDPDDVPHAHAFEAKIISKGSISARFVVNAEMEAGTDILIEEFSMHNHLTALNRILVGKSGGKKSHIIGGITSASMLVKAAIIGSNSGSTTKIKVGFNPYMQRQLERLKLGIEENEKEIEDIQKIGIFVMGNPEKNKNGLLNKLLRTREKLEADGAKLHEKRVQILSEMPIVDQVQVIVEEAVYCGAEIHIGHVVWKNDIDRGKGVFQLVNGVIDFGNIMLNVS